MARKALEAGAREGLARKAKPRRSPEQVELERLRRNNKRLEAELERTKTALQITGKVHALGTALRERGARDEVEVVIGEHLEDLEAVTSTKRACALLGASRASIDRGQLAIHADRGTSMTSKPVAQLLVDLGVARSHSRPHVSNDNPYSEANFKTLKYCPAFPGRFGSIEDARMFYAIFFDHYNHVHRHAGIGLHTPASVHYGTARDIQDQRAVTLNAAYTANPARFRHRRPTPPKLPTTAWINEPF